ncbi:hypothetical protein I316_00129 [Kwoniella heveanensis BCC8398]|uniref:PSP1 C-terminal domain-containing protein n=1 Tax=Kwoniella heveanensis BCC8398 TaxID=1296120 RepID=A0A1B9H3R3_9TREE|nr:hypothetical protein I316_00129 [Kwoniella heveanensis BCC8398]
MSVNSPSSQSRASPHPQSPNPNAPAFRPSPARAATLSGTPFQYKTRAASQPAGERIPPPATSTPGSGRGSPGAGTNGNGGAFGVIGGSRTPGRFGNALASGGGTATRANSFSAGEIREPRNITLNRTLSSHTEEFLPSRSHSTSPFPTFSPNSTPSTSPAALRQHPLPPSPPKVGANASRSRSQSLATGVRPSGIDRPWLGPMSTLENSGAFAKIEPGWNISPPEGSNMSPFSRGLSVLSNAAARDEAYARNGASQTLGSGGRLRAVQESFSARGGWGAPAPESNTSALSSSVHKALGGGFGQPPLSSTGGGFGEYNPNGSRSGTSSRRHSVSVVGGPGGRREFAFGEPGMGMTGLASPPNRGLFGFEGDLNNALNLDIDDRQRGDSTRTKDTFVSSSLPRFDPLCERFDNATNGHQRIPSLNRMSKPDPFNDGTFSTFGSTPPRGRLDNGLGAPGERGPSGDSKDASQKRFGPENAAVGSPARSNIRIGTNGTAVGSGSPERLKDILPPLRGPPGPGVIGSPASFQTQPPPFSSGPPGSQGSFPGARPYGPGPGAPFGPTSAGIGNGSAGPPPLPHMGGPPPFGRPQPGGFGGGYYPGLPRPSAGPGGAGAQGPYGGPPQPGFGPTNGSAPGPGTTGPLYGVQPGGPSPSGYSPYYPPPPASPPQPTSPSFSSLSLSDLGKGIILASLPATTPLYVVAFKAGRRDVYYCPDPTLLISNGDKVIVEADRGSDLGTVVYDQLTPIDVRDWQERQATAALLSGASQHQPPGLAVSGQSQPIDGHKRIPSNPAAKEVGQVANMDLDQLLAGVGPSGQLELTGTAVRGPLAKEIMPKRIFAKSSQGPEEQARMREKAQDEHDALMICREKVIQRGLPMTIVDAEYQWDRRKLTFYFKAEKRVDFRDLTKENFRIFKVRPIVMANVALGYL